MRKHRILMLLVALAVGGAVACTPKSNGNDDDDDDNNTTPTPDPPSGFSFNVIDSTIVHGQGMEVIDIDGDSDLDVVLATSLTDAVMLYVNGGDGTSWTPVEVGAAGTIVAMDVAVADFDGDADLDIASVGLFDRNVGFNSAGEVTWYENPGTVTGSWTTQPITGLTFWGPLYIEAGDLTGDGLADLVVGAYEFTDGGGTPQASGISWFGNTGGAFGAPTAVDLGMIDSATVRVHDVDADNVLDIVGVGRRIDSIAWYESSRTDGMVDPNPTFTQHVIASPTAPHELVFAHLDADPELELVATLSVGSGALVWYDPPADVTQLWAESQIDASFGTGENARVYVADFDGDQDNDAACGTLTSGEARVYLQTGGVWSLEHTLAVPGSSFLTGGDLNGDGRADILSTTYDAPTGDSVGWWQNEE